MLARGQSYRNFQVVSNFLVIFIAIFTVQNAVFFTFHPSPTQIATFQCVLMTDGTSSFVKFLYADGEMQWTKEDASGSTNGFGGTPAQVGFNAGDGKRFFSVPGSLTNRIMNIDSTTNVNIPGVWTFQVNGDIARCSDPEDMENSKPLYTQVPQNIFNVKSC